MKILFVCLGNICRSPMAEGLLKHHLNRLEIGHLFEVDSCGTGGWHAGELPDKRMRQTSLKNGIELTHRARQIEIDDFENFDLLLVMDKQNLEDVLKLNPAKSDKIKLITEYSSVYKGQIIPDPYFGDMKGFEEVFQLLNDVNSELAQYLDQQYRKL